jgi:peptidoglycan biosynthesis protein MviN/MurJ (putative lipid II flippase)
VVLLLAWQTVDTMPLIGGTLIGFGVQAVLLHWRAGGPRGLSISVRSEHWPALARAALVMGAGQFAMSFTVPADQWFASGVGGGAIATLGYANRIIALGTALGASVISRATLPIFAEGVAGGEGKRARRHALRWSWLMLLAGALGAAAASVLATPLTRLLFERGAFFPEDTQAVAEALRWGIWQVPPYLAGLVFISLIAAQRRYHVIAAIASVNLACKLAGNFYLAESMGVNGILLATVVMYCVSLALAWFAAAQPISAQTAAGAR